MEVRLQKYLADAGIASRRKAEELILQGRVEVNGKTVRELGTKIDDKKDTVSFNGKEIKTDQKLVYIMLYKPEGYVTTVKDQFDRPTVMDLIKNVEERVFPIGRLDYDTSGLLLLTNDGKLTFKLTHPKHEVEKTYLAKVYGVPDQNDMNQLRRGVMIDGKKTEPAKARLVSTSDKYANVEIIIHEGKNRQVRKMFDAVRHPVSQLRREATGSLSLGNMKKGEWRYLTEKEVRYLKSL